MGSVDVPAPPCGQDDCARLLDQLAGAIERRDDIGMAKGLIMAASDCGPDEAFTILRSASMNRNVKVHTLAVEMIAKRKDVTMRPRHSAPGQGAQVVSLRRADRPGLGLEPQP